MSVNEVILKSNGLYRVGEAARLVSWAEEQRGARPLTRGRLRGWVDSGVGLLRWADVPGGKEWITFRALISLRFIFRARGSGFPPKVITRDVCQLKQILGVDWPLASKRLWDPADKLGVPDIGIHWLADYRGGLNRHDELVFGEDGVACAWRPVKDVKIEPGIVSGAPCIDGTRIPTWVVFGMAEAGDSVEEIADWYELPEVRVRNAVDWEQQLAAIRV